MTALRDLKIIGQIAARAVTLYQSHGEAIERKTVYMDITIAHHSNPLRLDDLLAADDFNFAHDIAGINRHLDHATGKLDGRFLPRFTA